MVISTSHLAPAIAPVDPSTQPQNPPQGSALGTHTGAASHQQLEPLGAGTTASSADGTITPLGVGPEGFNTPALSEASGTPKRVATPTKLGGGGNGGPSVGGELTKPSTRASSPVPAGTAIGGGPTVYPGGFSFDVRAEASKVPLDVAIVNSIRAAGAADKIKKLLQVVLVVGGSALVPGMIHALESRCVFRARYRLIWGDRAKR